MQYVKFKDGDFGILVTEINDMIERERSDQFVDFETIEELQNLKKRRFRDDTSIAILSEADMKRFDLFDNAKEVNDWQKLTYEEVMN